MKPPSEKPFYRYPRFWYYLILFNATGWSLRGIAPDIKSVFTFFGFAITETIEYALYLNNALGGLVATIPAVLSIIGFLNRRKLKKKNK